MSARAASVEAQAKLNLNLRVVAHEEGGYHQLETLFVRIELADSVRVATDITTRELSVTGMTPGPREENLAWRAAVAFSEAAGWPRGFRIDLDKRIPVGGGLGGGSADAGAVLRAMNALAPSPLTPAALAALAFRLGADVPFLATDAALALAWGRGERILALRSLPAREVLLALPPFGVSTADAFGWFDTARSAAEADAPGNAPSGARAPFTIDDLDRWDAVTRHAGNDLEPVVFAHHPAIATCRDVLEKGGARIAQMSGSGSTVFGIFDRRPVLDATLFPAGTTLLSTRTTTSVAPVRLLD